MTYVCVWVCMYIIVWYTQLVVQSNLKCIHLFPKSVCPDKLILPTLLSVQHIAHKHICVQGSNCQILLLSPLTPFLFPTLPSPFVNM